MEIPQSASHDELDLENQHTDKEITWPQRKEMLEDTDMKEVVPSCPTRYQFLLNNTLYLKVKVKVHSKANQLVRVQSVPTKK